MSMEGCILGEEKPVVKYGIVCGLEPMDITKPVILRGKIEDIARTAAEFGYSGIELHIRNPKSYDPYEMKDRADKWGLEYCGIATGMEYLNNNLSLISNDISVRKAAVGRLKEHIDLGDILGACPVIIGIMRANLPAGTERKKYLQYHTDALLELSDYAQKKNVVIYVEAILRYITNYLNTCCETADYLDSLGRDNLRLHIDTHSMNVEEPDLAKAIRDCRGRIGYVHFTDSNRMYPGGGNIDFRSIIRALKEVGYSGYITFECVPIPSERECADRCITYTKALEVNIG